MGLKTWLSSEPEIERGALIRPEPAGSVEDKVQGSRLPLPGLSTHNLWGLL